MAALTPTCVLAVDAVILTVEQGALRILVQERAVDPYRGMPSLPGVLVREGESEGEAVRRVLTTKVNGADVYLSQVAAFAEPGRDPRGRVVSVVWGALVARAVANSLCAQGGRLSLAMITEDGTVVADGAGKALRLAFDHAAMVATTVRWLRNRMGSELTGAEMLGDEFSLRDLQEIYEAVHERAFDNSNFRTFAISKGIVVPTGRRAESSGPGRPGMLYRAAQRPSAPWEA